MNKQDQGQLIRKIEATQPNTWMDLLLHAEFGAVQ
jgi:hypothetical protein